jgi:HD-GYP domain-containing protein (c-di-GMP phosphodiesterase class II)
LSALSETPRDAASYAPLVPQRLCDHAARMLGTERAAVFVCEVRKPDRMIVVAATDTELIGGRYDVGGEPAAIALCAGEPVFVPDYRVLDRPLTLPWTGATRLAAAPISFSGALRGALAVWIPAGAPGFGLAELALLGELAELVAHSLGRRARWREPGPELDALAGDLAKADEQTADHMEHVVSLALDLGSLLGLAAAELFELELGARFHDIGKVRVPAGLLRKPARLTATEWDLMRLHSLWGAEMLAAIPGLEAVAVVVRAHHERYDGGGYPDGLTGERIPLAARIVSVCDAYSAMISERPYSRPRPTRRALRELELGAGTQFDPVVAAALAGVICKRGRFRRAVEVEPEPAIPRSP